MAGVSCSQRHSSLHLSHMLHLYPFIQSSDRPCDAVTHAFHVLRQWGNWNWEHTFLTSLSALLLSSFASSSYCLPLAQAVALTRERLPQPIGSSCSTGGRNFILVINGLLCPL